jgi:hypothetical protein
MPGSRRFARRRRSRIYAACPNCRHARDCTTRFFAGTACGASPVLSRWLLEMLLPDDALIRR